MTGERARALRNVRDVYGARAISLVSGIVMIPFLISSIGLSDFGLWVLGTSLVGYTGLMDAGVSVALTRFVARHRGKDDPDEVINAVSAAWTFSFLAGGVAAGAFV